MPTVNRLISANPLISSPALENKKFNKRLPLISALSNKRPTPKGGGGGGFGAY